VNTLDPFSKAISLGKGTGVEGKHNEQSAIDLPALLHPETMYSTQEK